VPAWLIAPDAAGRVASERSSILVAAGSAGVTPDDVAAWSPAWPWPGALEPVVDRGAPPRHPASIGAAHAAYAALFRGLQSAVGPVYGEGPPALVPELRHDALYAGYLDAFSPVLAGPGADGVGPGARGLVAPDFVLEAVRPRAAGYGFGPMARFLGRADGAPWSAAELDRYRALLLAYAHAPLWEAGPTDGPAPLGDADAASLYHGLRPLVAALQAADSVTVRYVGPDGLPRDLSRALADGLDLYGPRLVLEAAGMRATVLWINLGANVWTVEALGATWLLPPDGFLAEGPGLLAFSALVDGRRVDRVVTPALRLLDGRGTPVTVGADAARDLRIRFADGATLVEAPDGSLGWEAP